MERGERQEGRKKDSLWGPEYFSLPWWSNYLETYRSLKPSTMTLCRKDADNWSYSGSSGGSPWVFAVHLLFSSFWMKATVWAPKSLWCWRRIFCCINFVFWNEVCSFRGRSNWDTDNCTWLYAPKGDTHTHTHSDTLFFSRKLWLLAKSHCPSAGPHILTGNLSFLHTQTHTLTCRGHTHTRALL